jgi:hypothetical protein
MTARSGALALAFDRSRRMPQSPRIAAGHGVFQYGFKMPFSAEPVLIALPVTGTYLDSPELA